MNGLQKYLGTGEPRDARLTQGGALRRCRSTGPGLVCDGPSGRKSGGNCSSEPANLRPPLVRHFGWRAGVFSILALTIVIAGCMGDASKSAKSTEEPLEKVTEKGPVKLVIRVTPREPRLSDLVEMSVEVTAPADVDIKPPEFGEAVEDFLVRDYSERKIPPSTKSADAGTTRRFHYQLEPVSAGRHLIRSIAVEFVDRRSVPDATGKPVLIESDPVEVTIKSEFGDQVPSLGNLVPMLPPRPLEETSGFFWLSVIVAIVVIAVLLFWWKRRRKANAPQERRLTPEEIAHAALNKLLSENLPQKGLFKDFYLRLTGIVRYYIEGTTGLRAPEQTTEEFLRAMRSRNVFPVERSQRLAEFLEAADMVKYAGQQPNDDQIEVSIGRAREFVDMRTAPAAASNVSAGEA